MRRGIFYLVVLALAGTLIFAVWRSVGQSGSGQGRRGGPPSAAVAVETADVRQADLQDEGVFTGSLVPRLQFTVVPKVSGRLKRIGCEVGDRVKRGQLLAEIEDDEFALAVSQSEADLAMAKASVKEADALLESARREDDRVQTMRKQKVASEVEVENAHAQLRSREARSEVARAQVKQKEAALSASRLRLSYARIHAAWEEGADELLVGERFQDAGGTVSPGMPLLTLFNLATVTAVIDVVERDYYRLQLHQNVEVRTDALPGKAFTGVVARITPALNVSTRQGRVEIDLPNPDGVLKPGMFVTSRVRYRMHAGANVVPLTAIARRDGREGVFRVDVANSRVVFQPVEVGILQNGFIEVASPTLDGRVVTLGQHLLEDGSVVLLPEAVAAQAAKDEAAGQDASATGEGKRGKGAKAKPDRPGSETGNGSRQGGQG